MKPDEPKPGEELVPCPQCSSTLPFAGLIALTSYVRRKGRLVGFHSGERVACQQCGHVFSIGPAGSFKHSERALPLTPSVQPAGSHDSLRRQLAATTRDPEADEEERPLAPLPRPRPPMG